jgi:hypothetical protein
VSEDPIYQKARDEADARADQAESAEAPAPTGTLSQDIVQQMIDQALARQAKAHDAEMSQIRGQLTAARAALPATLIPGNAGGVGVDSVAETWSQYDQELANRGEHPHQHGKSADWLARPEDVDEHRQRITADA